MNVYNRSDGGDAPVDDAPIKKAMKVAIAAEKQCIRAECEAMKIRIELMSA